MCKLEAHRKGTLHRAYSVIVYRKQQGQLELLLQKRSPQKYHSAGLWSNACCSHDHLDTPVKEQARTRLLFEMGIEATLHYVDTFYYRAELNDGWIEHEIDQVFIVNASVESPPFNTDEVSHVQWVPYKTLLQDIKTNPHRYTAWLVPLLLAADLPNHCAGSASCG